MRARTLTHALMYNVRKIPQKQNELLDASVRFRLSLNLYKTARDTATGHKFKQTKRRKKNENSFLFFQKYRKF